MNFQSPAISVTGLGKRYRIGTRTSYSTLRDALTNAFTRSKANTHGKEADSTLWALRDISFEVSEGEVFGVIGANGAGKSTLLKILSRITRPTEGQVEGYGRVASLLEVGTGFHPELTGRENVYLSGAILGMSHREIKRRFDEIIDFSGVERFLDTPVKRYSSGMQVRLAFAVAAHLEAETILVDEVLAVGDASFQQRCLGKMEETVRTGRTVIFVSHNMNAVHRLCHRVLWLEGGRNREILPAAQAVAEYLETAGKGGSEAHFAETPASPAQFTSIRVLDDREQSSGEFNLSRPIRVELQYVLRTDDPGVYLTFFLTNTEGIVIFLADSRDTPVAPTPRAGRYYSTIEIPPNILAPGRYFLSAGIGTQNGLIPYDHRDHACAFAIHDVSSGRTDARMGVLGLRLPWKIEESKPPGQPT